MRFQLRCLDSPELMSLTTNVVANAGRWLVAHGASPADVAPLYNAEIADNDPRLARDDVSGIAAQYRWIEQGGGDRHDAQREARLDRLIGGPAGSPDLRAMVVVAGLSSNAKTRQRGAQDRAAELAAALVDFDAAWPSSYAGAWLRLEYALQLEKSRQFDLAKPQLDRVLALPVSVLPADDVVRTVATLHRAMLDRRAGNAAAAESRVAAAGMSPEQCALVDVRPVMTRAGVGSNDFPQDAFDWGFEGYVGYAFDINAAGEVVNARTVFAYPPFVFNAATEKTVRRFRYLPPVIGGEAVGCNQKIDAVRYQK
jgi:hypothetical protein